MWRKENEDYFPMLIYVAVTRCADYAYWWKIGENAHQKMGWKSKRTRNNVKTFRQYGVIWLTLIRVPIMKDTVNQRWITWKVSVYPCHVSVLHFQIWKQNISESLYHISHFIGWHLPCSVTVFPHQYTKARFESLENDFCFRVHPSLPPLY